METVAIQIWRAFQNMRRWSRKAFETGFYAIGLDNYSPTYPNCRHLSLQPAAWQYKSALCSEPHSGPLVCYSCIWYFTSGMGWKSRCNYWKKAQGVDGRLFSNETEGCLSKPLNKASSTTPPSSSTRPRSLSSGEHSFHFKMSRPKLHITPNCT